jgi:outer membrane protein assembly factor BamB
VSIDNNFSGAAFDHPLEVFGDTVVHVHRPRGRAGWVVAATDAKQGRTLWETDLAVPPAWSPIVDESGRMLVVANANGYVFRFDEAAIRSRIQDNPLATRGLPSPLPSLTAGADLGGGRAAFFAPDSDQLLLYDPAARDGTVQWLKLESPLACAVTPFGEGFLAPLKIGQVFFINPADGQPLAAPFQPRLQPRSMVAYLPAGAADRRFAITDGQEKIYLVGIEDEPQPHFDGLAEAKVGPYPIVSPVAVLGDLAIAATEGAHLVRFKLPALKAAGEVNLPSQVVWGPFRVGDRLVLATADEKLVGISPTGDVAWIEPLQNGDLAGPPLAVDGGLLIAYRNGILERRNLADGKPAGQRNVEHPLAAGPVKFLGRIVLAAGDGTLLVVDQP